MTAEQSQNPHSQPPSFWKSKAGITLLVFLGVAGLLLAYEHRVHILTGNAFLVLLLLACVGMHLFMHGGHDGHHQPADDRPGDDDRYRQGYRDGVEAGRRGGSQRGD